MVHLGSITEIDGAKIEPVDCITGGSPCQDLSIAGKRAGLEGERSGLFMEQIRIVKEMRNESIKQLRMRRADFDVRDVKPRYMVWENVCGAYSSNSGKDFQAVLSEIVKIVEPEAPDVPLPEKGRWPHAGSIYDEMGRWSLAYRTMDAQFWGVPQRRKRIALVADFNGGGAANILLEQYSGEGPRPEIQPFTEGVSRDSEPCGTQRKDVTETVGGSSEKAIEGGSISFQERAGKPGGGKGILIQNEHTGALSTLNNQSVLSINGKDVAPPLDAHYYLGAGARGGVEREAVMTYGISSYESNAMKSSNPHSGIYEAETARTLDNNGGSPDCNQGGMAVVYDPSRRHDYQPFGDVSETVQASYGTGGNNVPMVIEGVDVYNGKITGNVTAPLTCNSNATSTQPIVLEGNGARESHKGDGWRESETMYTLNTVEQHAVCHADGGCESSEVTPTLVGDHQNRVTDLTAITYTGTAWDGSQTSPTLTANSDNQRMPDKNNFNAVLSYGVDCYNQSQSEEVVKTLNSKSQDYDHVPCTYGLDRASYNQGQNAKFDFSIDTEMVGPQISRGPGAVSSACVRRLTPKECSRLQGYPDGWLDIGDWIDSKGKIHKDADSPKYKALGNSIAIPQWFWLLRRIAATYTRRATLGSLFDGIGGFPLCWEMCNGKGSARWASEIEEFPIAVTKIRFPEWQHETNGIIDPVISFTQGQAMILQVQ